MIEYKTYRNRFHGFTIEAFKIMGASWDGEVARVFTENGTVSNGGFVTVSEDFYNKNLSELVFGYLIKDEENMITRDEFSKTYTPVTE